MIMMPIITGSGSLLMTITFGNRPLYAVAGVMIMLASVAVGVIMFISQHNGPRKRIREQRERYLDYLDHLRGTVREVAGIQRRAAAFRHPAPHLLTEPARQTQRRWERRASDPDFLHLRVGQGTRPLARRLNLNIDTSNPLVAYDPVCQGIAEQIVDLYAHVSEQPLVVPLGEHGVVSLVGDRAAGRAAARAMVAQLATFCAPEDVRVGVVRHSRLLAEWDWLKWLPHGAFDGGRDGPLPARLVTSNTVEMTELLSAEIEQRTIDMQRRRNLPPGPGTQRLVVVVDGEFQSTLSGLSAEPPVASLADIGIHLIVLVGDRREEPGTVDLRLRVDADGRLAEDASEAAQQPEAAGAPGPPAAGTPLEGRADRADVAQLTTLGRILSPMRLAAADSGDALHSTVGLGAVLGVPDVAQLDPRSTWRPRSAGDFLRVPIGVGPSGSTVLLDLKESAFGGMGPHGLVVGATGSGKSEMLRTLVASLVIGHPPEHLALLLVDFKGGATFADTDALPHSAGLVTNLADDDSLVLRFREAMFGELMRRQQILKDVGNLPNLHAYETLRAGQRPDLEPLPHLLVIIDEFSELLTAHPDFAELFVAIGRIGRSIGVHLLLATQRLDSGKIKGLESHLSYRIGLRTFSEGESREAIGVGDAYHLPPEPGSGYLKVDTSVFERFKAAMVSQPYAPPAEDSGEDAPVLPLISFNGLDGLLGRSPAADEEDSAAAEPDGGQAPSTLQVAIRRLVEANAAPVRPVWLPPLPERVSLDELLRRLDEEATAPDGSPVEPDPAEAAAIVGLTDIPREQRQEAAALDFTGGASNIIVLGGPQSGKSTLIRTMIASLAWRYPPGRIAVYAIDFGGGSLAPFEDLPHVAGVAGRSDPERVHRVLADLRNLMDQRERVFRRSRIDSPAALRRGRADGSVPEGIFADVFLLVDGWAGVREAVEDADDILTDVVSRGPSLGVHTVVTGAANSQIRTKLQALFGGRLELRLSDPFDSQIGRKQAEQLPKEVPGRALRADESVLQVALPRLDGSEEDADLGEGVRDAIARIADRWPRRRAVPPVRVLPAGVGLDELLPAHSGPGLVLGMGERDLAPAVYRQDEDPHLVVFGDPQTGKSTLLRALLRQIIARPASEVGVVLVDYRRAHLGLVGEDHLLAYSTGPEHTKAVAAELASSVRERLPGPDVTPRQLRERSWWKGLELYVVVDDLDLVAGRNNPLAPLAEFLTQGADLGLHLVTARRTGGSSRAVYEPVAQTLSDMATPGVLFSGDRMEGRIANGVASRRLPQGRALIARRGRPPEQVQVAWSEPPE
ncbi:type VII secretion protein EccCa [Streptomonospora wellingtoniae]|uniref:Type VII secretion protein EccCa n=1 Tax=Streptomonospora wellingtoniae TaxID=3075544 RepID=A0ABU2KT91_9ACTN|nr:type VII secretion protein EccCa [Streptomonospora sp. DSM 45055]MDT0302504.1 type VII secretion protein EccCa [Streptomonospora sp. DSM 45055]